MSKQTIDLTANERAALRAFESRGETIHKVERRSEREFDLSLEGEKDWGLSKPVRFSAWLPLSAIREFTNWPDPRIGSMADYPGMATGGDWSGIRDSDPETIWAIFEAHAIEPLLVAGGPERVDEVVAVGFYELVNGGDIEALNDLIEERIGKGILSGASYEVVGHEGNTIHLRVTAEVFE